MKISRLFVISLMVMLAGCGGGYVKPETPIKRVAVVSIAVAATHLTIGVRTESLRKLVELTSDDLVKATEEKLSTIMHVTPVADFINIPAYRAAGITDIGEKGEGDYVMPRINGNLMVRFSENDDDILEATLKPELARKLCADLKVDGVVVVYSEWNHDSAGFVPLERAYTYTMVSLWDAHGVEVFKKYAETVGSNYVAPPYGPVYVGRHNINEWSSAYGMALDELIPEMKRLTK